MSFLLSQEKSPPRSNFSGITIIELLLILAMLGILAGSVTPFMSKLIFQNSMDVVVDDFSSSIRKAQMYSMDALDGQVWGVCITNNLLRLFSGSCLSPEVSEDFVIPGSVTVSGFSEVTFSRYRGEPSSTQTFTLTTSVESVEISINEAGVIEID